MARKDKDLYKPPQNQEKVYIFTHIHTTITLIYCYLSQSSSNFIIGGSLVGTTLVIWKRETPLLLFCRSRTCSHRIPSRRTYQLTNLGSSFWCRLQGIFSNSSLEMQLYHSILYIQMKICLHQGGLFTIEIKTKSGAQRLVAEEMAQGEQNNSRGLVTISSGA